MGEMKFQHDKAAYRGREAAQMVDIQRFSWILE